MKNKGFTLIELLGVIIILALLMIIVFPSIVNSVKNSSNKTDDLTKELIYNASDLFIDQHINDFPKMNGSKYSIELSDLVDEGLLTGPIKLSDSDQDITNNKCIQVTYNNDYIYELKDSGTCVETIKYSLPEEYQQVEYIESTGTQYIDIKYSYKINDEINIEFSKTKDTGSIQGIFGNGNLSTYTGTVLYINNQNILTVTIGGVLGQEFYKYETPIENNVRYTIKYKTNNVYLDGNKVITVTNEVKDGTQEDFSLFRRWGTNGMNGRIYNFNIKRNNEIIRNFIPCYRTTDNVIGMYDTVNNVFYTNSGTGTFVKGGDI